MTTSSKMELRGKMVVILKIFFYCLGLILIFRLGEFSIKYEVWQVKFSLGLIY